MHHDVELHLHFPKALNAAIQWRGDRPRLVTCWYLIFFVIDMNCLVVLLVLPRLCSVVVFDDRTCCATTTINKKQEDRRA